MTKRNKIDEASDIKTAHVIKRHYFRIQVVYAIKVLFHIMF